MLVDVILTLLNLTENSLPETDLQIQAAPRVEEAICFFYGAPCTEHFHRVKCPKSCFAVLVFHHLNYSDFKNLFLTNVKNTEGTFKTLLKHLRWSLCKVS